MTDSIILATLYLLQCKIITKVRLMQDSDKLKIKKYANRRLYDTEQSAYITLSELAKLVQSGRKIDVRDAKTDDDLTRLTLVQIILEIETEGHQMLPVEALRQIIMAYGGKHEVLFSRYLERTMSAFTRQQHNADRLLNSSLDTIRNDSLKPQYETSISNDAENYADIRSELDALKAKLDKLST